MNDFKDVHATIMERIGELWEATAVQWPHVPFDGAAVEEWIQPSVVSQMSNPSRMTDVDEEYVLNINVFHKRSSDAHRVYELRDGIAALFARTNIMLLEAGALLRFEEAQSKEVPRPLGQEDNLEQINVTLIGRIIQ